MATATLADVHAHWHQLYGADAPCPLDCGAGETPEEEEVEAATIRCGHCKGYHCSVDQVRACSAASYARR